jgi:hypothetical protein
LKSATQVAHYKNIEIETKEDLKPMNVCKSHAKSIRRLFEYKKIAVERYHKKGIIHYLWFAHITFISGGTCIFFNLEFGLSWFFTSLSIALALFFAKMMLAVNYIQLWPMILGSWITNSPIESMGRNITKE